MAFIHSFTIIHTRKAYIHTPAHTLACSIHILTRSLSLTHTQSTHIHIHVYSLSASPPEDTTAQRLPKCNSPHHHGLLPTSYQTYSLLHTNFKKNKDLSQFLLHFKLFRYALLSSFYDTNPSFKIYTNHTGDSLIFFG